MINKLYEKIKQNLKLICFFVVIILLFFVELPYYIDTGGGIINLKDRVVINNEYEEEGSFNLTYVSELKGNIAFVLFSFINPNWKLIKKSDVVSSNETASESRFRNKMLLNEANTSAIISAFTLAGKKYKIKSSKLYITYIDKNSNTNLKIGDQILEVDNKKLNKKELKEYILSKNSNDVIKFKVLNNNKQYERRAKITKEKVIGILITEDIKLTTYPEVTFKFKSSESGPSAGLMTSLEIYNAITKQDITKGKTIAGTGTIDSSGNVGSIGGIEYKLSSAVKDRADIFFVPNGKNLKQAKELKKQKNYKIKIIGVSNLKEAIKNLDF